MISAEEQNDERSRELEQFSADQAKARSKKHEDEAYQKRALTYHQIDKEQEERRKIGEIEKEIQTDFLSEFFKGIHPTDLSEREREQLAKQENAEANEDNDDVDPNLPPIRRKAVLTTTFTPKPGNFNLPAREKEMKPVVHRPQLPVFTDDESKYQSVEYLSQRGDSSFKAKDFHNALEQYNSALSLDPRHTPSLLHRCVVHLSLSHWQNALEDALEIDKLLTDPDTAPSPNTPKVRSKNWARAALACNEMRRFEDALSYISRAIQLDPDNQEFLQQRTHYEANVTAQKVERAKAFGSSSTSESGGSIVAEHFSVT
ncbi:hypothetical protein BLNAU_600 [Blattamonas nauphoetae]|uniref:Tetratricopeptide repeat protein n=1 Tax=Blattamonas nauphoetae TaxID=2049346 RepID=A0ABQ9YLP5_9EUKA|nr:hypothetical protein BLNAU_600 [Blattamonas nauphoetae]